MSRPYWIMHRIGVFEPAKLDAPNQCKAPGWPAYEYELRLVCHGQMQLDNDGFIVEHQDIDDLVQALKFEGSCEQLALKIAQRVVKMFGYKKIPLAAIRCKIRPSGIQPSAWFEWVEATGDDVACLMLV